MANAMNTSKELDDLLAQGEIPRLLNQELKERKPLKQIFEPTHSNVPPSSSKEFSVQSSSAMAPPHPAITNLGKRKDEHLNSPSPSPALAQGFVPMLNGDVLHPFVVVAKRHEKEQVTEADKAAVREVCTFFMRMKLNARLFQRNVHWRNPGLRLTEVLDKANRQAANSALATSARKGSKQQRRSFAGVGRDSSESGTGLAVEWNLEVGSSWVWNDNQEGAAKSDPKILTRLLQEACYLPDESDYLTEGKTVMPIDMLSSTYTRFLAKRASYIRCPLQGQQRKGKGAMVNTRARMDDSRARMVGSRARMDDSRARMVGSRARMDDSRARMIDSSTRMDDSRARMVDSRARMVDSKYVCHDCAYCRSARRQRN
jgi:hypothetical protein